MSIKTTILTFTLSFSVAMKMEDTNTTLALDSLTMIDVSDDVLNIVNISVNFILITVLSCSGVVGNFLTIVIIVRNGLRETLIINLSALAVSDLFFSLTQLWCQLADILQYFNLEAGAYTYVYFVVYIFGWNQYAVCVSVQMAALIAVERMIAVVFPFAASRFMTTFRIQLIVIGVFLFAAILYVPRAFMYSVIWKYDNTTNITIPILDYGIFLKYRMNLFIIYNVGIIGTYAAILPTVTILISTSSIILKLKVSQNAVKKMVLSSAKSKRNQDVRNIKITLSICFCVIVCVLLPSNTFFFCLQLIFGFL